MEIEANDEQRFEEVLRELGPGKVRERLDLGRWSRRAEWKVKRARAYLEAVDAEQGVPYRGAQADRKAKAVGFRGWVGLIALLALHFKLFGIL